jgi:poly(hydroxyalkanoate) granule-associated protein
MVKKLQKMAGKGKSNGGSGAAMLDSQFAQSVKDSAQQIWSAGLGAFSKAQGEGSKVFEALVKEGMNAQKRTQAVAEEKFVAMAGKVSDLAGDVSSKAGKQWDKMEAIVEDRIAQALKRLGVPSTKDLEALNRRIDALSKGAKPAPKPAAAPKPTVKTVKPVAKAVTKPVAKPAAKASIQPAAKTAAKATPAITAVTKPVAKKAAKVAVPALPKAAPKSAAKAPPLVPAAPAPAAPI